LGRMETRQQVMIPCLKEVKSIPIQVRHHFKEQQCGQKKNYQSPNVRIQSSLWCIGKEED
jgi:hypothetical protein